MNSIYSEWVVRWGKTVTPSYAKQVKNALDSNILSLIGELDIKTITPKDIVETLTPMEARGALVYLQKTKRALGMIFDFAISLDFAISRGIIVHNPANSITNNAFDKPQKTHFAALTPEQLPQFLNILQNSGEFLVTKYCILFLLLTLVRPSEATNAEESEIDLKSKIWVIPAIRMKRRIEHRSPLSSAVIEILKRIKPITGKRQFIFTGQDLKSAINRETPRLALRGFRSQGIDTTFYGLRALGRTYLEQTGKFKYEALEAALAHAKKNKTEAAYNRHNYFDERKKIMEFWGKVIQKYTNFDHLQ